MLDLFLDDQALDFYLTDLLAKYQKWLVESPSKMEIRLDNTGNMMKEMVARQVIIMIIVLDAWNDTSNRIHWLDDVTPCMLI